MRHSFRLSAAAVLVTITASLAGCSSEGDHERTAMSVEKTCLQTQCDAKMRRDAEACSRCRSACFDAMDYYDCDPSSACKASCSDEPTSCTDSDRTTCVQQGFTAKLADEPSAGVEAACVRFIDHFEACGKEHLHGSDICATWAKVQRPEAAQAYDCAVAAGCDGDTSACSPPATTFGQEVCDAIDATCGEPQFGPNARAALDALSGWFRDDVLAAGRRCAAETSCGDAVECWTAWVNALSL